MEGSGMEVVFGKNAKEITCTITEGNNKQTFRFPFALQYDAETAKNQAIMGFRELFPAETKQEN